MFRFIRRLVTLAIVLVVVLVLVIVFLPRKYEREYLVHIDKPRPLVFERAKNLKSWNLAATMDGIDLDMAKGLNTPDGLPGVDSLRDALKGFAELANIQCKLIRVEEPQSLVYELVGGPLDGLKPKMTFMEVEDKSTLVSLTESYQFVGLLGGIKAFSAKFAMDKLNARNMENLKTLCENTP
ncbi:MAG: hypothetical protein KDC45_12820 [Bacteroidetes bacterium]|nr:hypothetical protein [Bacteroidota bacterium]